VHVPLTPANLVPPATPATVAAAEAPLGLATPGVVTAPAPSAADLQARIMADMAAGRMPDPALMAQYQAALTAPAPVAPPAAPVAPPAIAGAPVAQAISESAQAKALAAFTLGAAR
jgi:hypothetical protein